MKKLILIMLIPIIFGTACKTYKPPTKKKIENERVINKNYEEVWSGIIEWFSNNNTPIKTIEKSSGFIATEYNLDADNVSLYTDCGEPGSMQKIGDRIGNFNIHVTKIDSKKTKVRVKVFFKANLLTQDFTREQTVFHTPYNRSPIDCESTGMLEKNILDFISN